MQESPRRRLPCRVGWNWQPLVLTRHEKQETWWSQNRDHLELNRHVHQQEHSPRRQERFGSLRYQNRKSSHDYKRLSRERLRSDHDFPEQRYWNRVKDKQGNQEHKTERLQGYDENWKMGQRDWGLEKGSQSVCKPILNPGRIGLKPMIIQCSILLLTIIIWLDLNL